MKKWFIKIIVGLFLIIIVLVTSAFVLERIDKAVIEKYVRNENLETVKAGWKGTPVDQEGRFVNVEYPFLPSTVELLKWRMSSNPQAEEKKNDRSPLRVLDPSEFLNGAGDGILWLGHASVLLRLNDKTILVDPVFGNPSFIERYIEVPSPLEKIRRVDYVLISHDHRDHMDEPTIRVIAEKFPEAQFLAGLGAEKLLNEWIDNAERIKTAGWFQRFAVEDEDLKIAFVPVRHWSRRGLFDTNERLWGGYVIQGGGKTFYHGGDSGYGSHYREMAETFPEIDYFIIGIGSYAPRWFMQPNHNNPEDALQAFIDSRAKILVPMHYATFNMSDEPPSEPLRSLQEKADEAGVADKIKPLQIYESLNF